MENIYERIRSLRVNMNMTLKELSEKAGLSISFLSQVERGNSSLAITSLQKIADVFNVSMSSFFESTVSKSFFTPVEGRKTFQIERSNSVFARLGGNFSGKILEPIHIAKRCDVIMKTLFGIDAVEDARVTMGTVVFPPGIRVPAEGAGVHAEHEYSFVMSGSLLTVSGGKECRISEGQASLIPAGEEHWAFNDGTENCELIWVLVK